MANFITFVGTLLVLLLIVLAFLAMFPDGAGALVCVLPIAFIITLPLMRRLVRDASPIPNRVARLFVNTVTFIRTDVQEVKEYRRYLYTRVPLIGGWFRHRAAEALSQDGSANAMELLAEALTRGGDKRVRGIALTALQQMTDWRAISAACEVWAATRHPQLTALLVQYRWIASTPPEVRVLTALKVGDLDVVTKGKANIVAPLAQACDDADPTIAEQAQQAIRKLEDEELQETLCRLAIEQDNPVAYDIVIEAGYLPQDEQLRALLFFMTEQWERYDLLDFDRHLLRVAYTAADGPLKQRIRDKLRATGRTDFLSIVAGEDYRDRIAKMSSSEIDLLVQTLTTNREWVKLWGLALEVPFIRSVRIVDTLARNAWSPERDDERVVFQELASLAGSELLMNEEEVRRLFPSTLLRNHAEASELLPPALLRAKAKVPGRINDVAFSPVRPVIAVGTGRRKVVLWNYQRAERERVLGGFNHSIGSVAFTGDGVLLCAERTNLVSAPCSIFGWDDGGDRFLLGEHTGSVTAIAPVAETRMLSAGRDGEIILWDVPGRKEIARHNHYDWPRDLSVSPDGKQAMRLGGYRLELTSLPSLADSGLWSSAAKARCATFASKDGDRLIVGRSDGQVVVYRLESRMVRVSSRANVPRQRRFVLVRDGGVLTRHQGRVGEATFLPSHSVAISASSDGDIRFSSVDERTFLGSVRAPLGRLTSLHVSPDESFMAVGSSEAQLSLWDLRTLGVQGLLLRPFAEATVSILPILGILSESQELSSRARLALKYTECALRHRFRFDIELGEAPTIMMGEFDIEIEG